MNNAEKFEEVFGEKPITSNKPYSCPGYLGSNSCYSCKYSEQTRTSYSVTTRCHILDWWDEEYKDPRYHIEAVAVVGTEKAQQHAKVMDKKIAYAFIEEMKKRVDALENDKKWGKINYGSFKY